MKILSQIRFYLVVVIIAFLSLGINYLNLKDELTKCQTDKGYIPSGDIEKAELQNKIDSLNSEMFNIQNEVGRYEITYEIFKERNPKGAKEFDDILSHETE